MMKSRALSVLLFLFSGAAMGQSASATGTATISGVVINQVTQLPLDGVELWFKSDAGPYQGTRTDRDGSFTLRAPAPRAYRIALSRAGFSETENSKTPRRLTLNAGDGLKDLRFEMTPNSALSGRLIAHNGQPLSPAIVVAIKVDYLNGRRVLLPGGPLNSRLVYLPFGPDPMSAEPDPELLSIMAAPHQARADERGEYRIFNLTPGEYYVAIWQKGSTDPTADLPPVYYPGVTDPAAASPIKVRGNEEMTGIDIRVPPISAYSAHFNVIEPTSPFNCVVTDTSPQVQSVVSNSKSFILVQHAASLDVVHFANTRNLSRGGDTGGDSAPLNRLRAVGAGEWVTGKLPPGSYELFVGGCGSTGIRPLGRLVFDIADRDIDAGTVQVSGAAILRGHVHARAGTSIPLSDMVLRLRPTDWRGLSPALTPNPLPSGKQKVDSDGAFAFQVNWRPPNMIFGVVTPGHYQIDIGNLPADAYVASIKYEAKEVRDSGIDVGAEITSDLDITLDSPGGTVQGLVRNMQGVPVPNATVALVPQRTEGTIPISPVTRSDQAGAFLFRGIAPGTYTVFASETIPEGAYDDPAFLLPYQGRGTRIQVKKGSANSLDLRVIADD